MSKNPVELITIQRNYPAQDANTAENTDSWQTFCQVYAELQIGNGREYFGAKKYVEELDGIIKTMQFVRGILPDMRILWQGKYYEILTVNEMQHLNKVELKIKKVF